MSLILPAKLEQFRHDDIVRLIKQLNSKYELPRRGSWGQGIPDLEEPITRAVVEVAIARELKTVWGQCLYYYRLGASHIHLVLSPKLFRQYRTNECTFIKENPITNVDVYMLPDTRLPFIVSHKFKRKQTKNKDVKSPDSIDKGTDEDIDNDDLEMTNEDDVGLIALNLLSDNPCSNCKAGTAQGEGIFCKRYGWIIVKELADKQRLCAF